MESTLLSGGLGADDPESDGEVGLSPQEEKALVEAMAEADRGETISAEELFARLAAQDETTHLPPIQLKPSKAASKTTTWRREEIYGDDGR